MSRTYLLVLAERQAIAWVLREQRMAFPAMPRAEVSALATGDRLFLYATRGAWGNPTRDRGRIIGAAGATSSVRTLDRPVEIGGRSFWSQCELTFEGLIPYPGGLEVQPLVERLAVFPKPHARSVYLRRPLLALPDSDVTLIDGLLRPLLVSRTAALPTYPTTTAAATR